MRALCLLFLALAFLRPSNLLAEESHDHGVVLLRSGEVYTGDYFALGHSVEVSGLIKGDAYVLASQAIIDGTITGDLIIVGGSVEIPGEVQGNVRVSGGQFTLSGKIGRNLTAFTANVQLLSAGTVNGNIVVATGNADIASTLGGNVNLAVSNLRLSSKITGNVAAYVGEMRISSKAVINGNLDYRGHAPAWIDPHAVIKGDTIYHPSLLHNIAQWPWLKRIIIGSKVAGLLMNFFYTFVLGWILIRVFPQKLERTLESLHDNPGRALWLGVVLLVVLPLVSLLLLVTVVGAPFALTLIALNIIGLYTAKIFFILWVSNKLFGRIGLTPNKLPILASGQVVYYVATAIPFVGVCISFLAMLFGLGAIVMAESKKATSFLHRD